MITNEDISETSRIFDNYDNLDKFISSNDVLKDCKKYLLDTEFNTSIDEFINANSNKIKENSNIKNLSYTLNPLNINPPKLFIALSQKIWV